MISEMTPDEMVAYLRNYEPLNPRVGEVIRWIKSAAAARRAPRWELAPPGYLYTPGEPWRRERPNGGVSISGHSGSNIWSNISPFPVKVLHLGEVFDDE